MSEFVLLPPCFAKTNNSSRRNCVLNFVLLDSNLFCAISRACCQSVKTWSLLHSSVVDFGKVSNSSEVDVDAIQVSISDFPILPETVSLDLSRENTAGGVMARDEGGTVGARVP